MVEVTIEEAEIRLSELMVRAIEGEEVFITHNGERVAQLVPVLTNVDPQPNTERSEAES